MTVRQVVKVETEFIWLRMRFTGRLLWTW